MESKIFITGDTHRDFKRLDSIKDDKPEMLIILGDVGINYMLNEEDEENKKYLNGLQIKLFCVRGNHEERPENIKTYKEKTMFGGKVYIEDEYPNLIFAKDGEVYNINGKSVLVIGGAYSIDAGYGLKYKTRLFEDEQLTEEEKNKILEKVKGKHFDVVLTHTCPLKYEPTEMFMDWVDQSKIDKSMELFLDKVEEKIDYDKWYCGHYHTEKKIDKLEFMFGRIKVFLKDEFVPKYDSNGYEIVRDFCKQEDIYKNDRVCCPKCNSKNVIVEKGDGEYIKGLDTIAIICNDCKKVYGFNNVVYKSNAPREM